VTHRSVAARRAVHRRHSRAYWFVSFDEAGGLCEALECGNRRTRAARASATLHWTIQGSGTTADVAGTARVVASGSTRRDALRTPVDALKERGTGLSPVRTTKATCRPMAVPEQQYP